MKYHAQTICDCLVELKTRAAEDICGEIRPFYLDRTHKAFIAAGHMFPLEMAKALSRNEQLAARADAEGGG